MYPRPVLIGADSEMPYFPSSHVPSASDAMLIGGGLAIGTIVLNVALFGLLTYGVYRLVKG